MCERSESARRDVFGRAKQVHYSRRMRFFLGLTARKTSRCNLVIEISFVPSSQSTLNFSVLRGTQVDFLLFKLLRPGPGNVFFGAKCDLLDDFLLNRSILSEIC